ncbi:MAG TPA: class I SAM-dependent methyltransferase [Candidatus Methanoperedens sp.]|nr:class I SAM-dependent methyltransferase [Candidatus Methanoperedens sp.]
MSDSKYKQTLEWYEKNASQYSEKSKSNSTIDRNQLDDFVSYIKPGERILDAGCGSGRDTSILSDLGFNAIGVDVSENLLEEAKKSYPRVDFRKGDILNLDFEDNFFGGVWAHASIVHFETDKQVFTALSELIRVLEVGGILHLLVRAKTKEKTEIRSDSISGGFGRFYRNFDREELEKYFKSNKIKLIKIQQYNESDLDSNKRPGEGIEWILLLGKKF